jgi:hypothetical protein
MVEGYFRHQRPQPDIQPEKSEARPDGALLIRANGSSRQIRNLPNLLVLRSNGGHHGELPFVPLQQVEHVAAPTSLVSSVKKAFANGAPSTHGTSLAN